MKKYLLPLLAVAVVSCQKVSLYDEEETAEEHETKTVTFKVNGDFGTPTFTRAALSADGREMTDLWIFDYMGDECVQTIHQDSGDDDFGEPSLSLVYGAHHIYFVASRGVDPDLNEEDHIIVWSSVRDTFWQDYEVTISRTSDTDHDVTLDRVVSKLKVTVNDRIPEGFAKLIIEPAKWYYGLDYTDGSMAWESNDEISVSIPSNYIGTVGNLSASFFTMSSDDEWTTNLTVTAVNSNNVILGTASISNAPFVANRATAYSGNLFSNMNAFTISLNDTWLSDEVLTW